MISLVHKIKQKNLKIKTKKMRQENDILNDFSLESDENTNNIIDENDILNNMSFLEEESKKEEILNDDFLKSLEEATLEEIPKKGLLNKIIGYITFFIKYLWTSTAIFVVLLFVTNYNAYIEIARSYLNPEAMEITKNSMYASINSSSITNVQTWTTIDEEENIENNILESETTIEDKINMVKNKNFHSMDKLVGFNDEVPLNIEITPYENRVIIPKIWKNIPLIDVKKKTVKNVKELEDVFMQELINWIVRYPWSAKPWEIWNTFIFWHSSNFPWLEWKYNDVFALLDNVVFWDEVIVYYNQKKYVYKITRKEVIKPGDTSVLKSENWKKEISLMTCWPVWTTLNRMIVIWELVE